MEHYGLDLHGQMLLDEYRDKRPQFEQLRQVVMSKLEAAVRQSGMQLDSMESRVKGEKSLAGKLQRKGHKYQSLSDITDILGARIITFYNEDVDRISSIVETLFDIDWPNSVDKRKMHQFDSFGYNSLHYICRVPRQLYFDPEHPELNDLPFELQMRTALQHVWSAIQHDIGYKTDIETPMEYHRDLSRLAGLLELADNEFSRIRKSISDYRHRARNLMEDGKFDKVPLDGDTFRSYLNMHPFEKLNHRIAAITQAEFYPGSFIPFLRVLRQLLGLNTLADVERMIKELREDAYQLALSQLGATDIDILADTIGLQNLCVVAILKAGGGRNGVRNMFDIINGPSPHNEYMADVLVKQASKLSFMSQ